MVWTHVILLVTVLIGQNCFRISSASAPSEKLLILNHFLQKRTEILYDTVGNVSPNSERPLTHYQRYQDRWSAPSQIRLASWIQYPKKLELHLVVSKGKGRSSLMEKKLGHKIRHYTYLTLWQGERAAVAGAVASCRHIPTAPTVQNTPAVPPTVISGTKCGVHRVLLLSVTYIYIVRLARKV